MTELRLDHFRRAAADIGAHGDNDTLPFDIDTVFVNESREPLAELAFDYFKRLAAGGKGAAKDAINSLQVFSERLLSPSGSSGFRVSTKIHPFWP